MTAPNFLASTFRFLEFSLSDVADVITNVRSECVTSGSYTEPSSNLFKSPVDSAGRFFDILLTRISATNLEFRVRDQNAATICTRRAQIDVGGTVRLFSGQFHLMIESVRTGPTSEMLYAGTVDESPEAQSSHADYVYGGGHRDTSDAANNQLADQNFMLDAGVAISARRCKVPYAFNGSNWPMTSPTGALTFLPVDMHADIAGTVYMVGRKYQTLWCPSTIAPGSEVIVPLDSSTTGTFKVLGYPAVLSDNSITDQVRMCMRKA